MAEIKHPFSLEELRGLRAIIAQVYEGMPASIQLMFRYGNVDSSLYISLCCLKPETDKIDVPDFRIKETYVLTDPLENMPLYVNESWLKQIIAEWRLSIGK